MKLNKGTNLARVLIGACASLALPAAAALAAGADAGTDALAEIVVTAEKTSEPLSKVPISISALSGAALEDEHISDYSDLSRAVPNLSFTSFGGPGQDNIEIRGVSSQAGSATTGIYLDDVPINVLNLYTTGATEPRFFDIDRVEVLRGPQGTIYGASSMGGTIHFVSNQPNLSEYSGSVHSSVGGTQGGGVNYQGDSVVNLPLIDGVAALRLGALYDHESGWIDRVSPDGATVARDINDENTTVVRATLEWRPNEALTVIPAAFLQRIDTGGQDLFGLAQPEFESPTLIPETARDEFAITSLTLKYDFGWSDLTSISGYFWRRDDRNIDGTFYDSVYLGSILQQQFGYGGAAIGALPAPVQFNTNINQVQQEIRLASKPPGADDHWSWIGGLYYSRTRTGLLDNEHIPGLTSTFESTYGNTPQNLIGASFPADLIYYAFSEFVNTQKAIFGQATYKITPDLKLTAGARYEKATEDLAFETNGYFAGGTPPFSGAANGGATTPKAVISYDLSSTSMIYASAAEGYRDGGVNRPVPVPLCSADLATLGLTQAPEDRISPTSCGATRWARRAGPCRTRWCSPARCSTSAGTTSRPTSSSPPAASTSRTTSAVPKAGAWSWRRRSASSTASPYRSAATTPPQRSSSLLPFSASKRATGFQAYRIIRSPPPSSMRNPSPAAAAEPCAPTPSGSDRARERSFTGTRISIGPPIS